MACTARPQAAAAPAVLLLPPARLFVQLLSPTGPASSLFGAGGADHKRQRGYSLLSSRRRAAP
jgi:hypothetical protein